MAPGVEQELPNSTILDDVLGDEVLALFVCEHQELDEVLRAHVASGAPAGCQVTRRLLHKEAAASRQKGPP
jgi:hypothetical protein